MDQEAVLLRAYGNGTAVLIDRDSMSPKGPTGIRVLSATKRVRLAFDSLADHVLCRGGRLSLSFSQETARAGAAGSV